MKPLLENLQRQGFVRLRVNGEVMEIDEAATQWPTKVKHLEVVVDRLVVRDGVMSRLADSVETALRICGSQTMALVMEPDTDQFDEISFLTSYRNPTTGFELPALTPKHFSFNSRHGAVSRSMVNGPSTMLAEISPSHTLPAWLRPPARV